MSKRARVFSILLAVCFALLAPVSIHAAGVGYSDLTHIYSLEGVGGNLAVNGRAYLFGRADQPGSGYAFVQQSDNRGTFSVDVISKAEFDKLLDTTLSTSQVSIANMNELLLAEGIPSEFLVIDEKPDLVADIERAAAAGQKTMTVNNEIVAFPDALRLAAANGITRINFDSYVDNTIDTRISINPANAAKGFGTVACCCVKEPDERVARMMANYYANDTFARVDFDQGGSFGVNVKVSARVSQFAGLDTSSLYFYRYDGLTNQIAALPDTQYAIDSTGYYVEFYTTAGGTIVITDSPLAGK